MVLARWQATIVDEEGNVLPAAQVTVRRETAGAPLAVLKSDRAGATPLGNPFLADADGFAAFHVVGGAYRIDATLGSLTRTWRYVAIGVAAEADGQTTGLRFQFSSSTTNADPGAGFFKFNNATLATVTAIYVDDLTYDALDVSSYLSSFDDGGATGDRGVVLIEQAGGAGLMLATVTGTVASAATYKTLSVTPIATSGAFSADAVCSISFYRSGLTGGDVVGPASAVSLNLARFSGTTGKLIADAGVSINTVGAGKQTIWIPASSMLALAGAPASATLTATFSSIPHLDFDATTGEASYFSIAMPKSWDEGNISAKFYWTHPAAVTNFGVAWRIAAVAYTDNETIDGSNFAFSASIVDTGGTTSNLYISPECTPFAPGDSPVEGDLLNFRAERVPADAGDTLAVDAFLIGVMLFYTTNANTDA